ncbi:hypothetical protein BTVI_44996 [Pitangus sulphuratus]|nr:hypothetical protein BTVI_44996 [Pitangus sulphuratus]
MLLGFLVDIHKSNFLLRVGHVIFKIKGRTGALRKEKSSERGQLSAISLCALLRDSMDMGHCIGLVHPQQWQKYHITIQQQKWQQGSFSDVIAVTVLQLIRFASRDDREK